MNLKSKLCIALMASSYIFSSCNNDSSTSASDSTDSSASQSTNAAKEKSNGQGNNNATVDLMSPMTSMMNRMNAIPMTADFDIDFAKMMIEHHQAAIDMSELELNIGKDEQMKSMAQKIVTAQKAEIGQLEDFIKDYKQSGMKHGKGELQKSMQEMEGKMKSMQMSGNTDRDFAMMMSTHHADAIAMSEMELANGMSGKLKQMAHKTISDQGKEINEFKAWLDKNNK